MSLRRNICLALLLTGSVVLGFSSFGPLSREFSGAASAVDHVSIARIARAAGTVSHRFGISELAIREADEH